MIAFLRGRMAGLAAGGVLLDVGGVGYLVQTPASTVARLPVKGQVLSLHTWMLVREGAIDMYGFRTIQERETFGLLLGVGGVGPKLALSILSALSPTMVHKAIAGEDVAALTEIVGVGKRSAQRIIVELKERVWMDADAHEAMGLNEDSNGRGVAMSQVRQALLALGYTAKESAPALEALAQREGSVEELVRIALKELK